VNLIYGIDEALARLVVDSGRCLLYERYRGQIYRQSIRDSVQVSGYDPNIYEQETILSTYIVV